MRPPDLTDQPPPREVQGGPGGWIWFGRLFVLPHTLVGLAGLAALLYLPLWALLASERPGTVERAYSRSARGQTDYYIDYAYPVGSELRHGTSSVDAEVYQRLEAAPAEARVRYWGLGRLGHGELVGAATWGFWLAELFMLVWVGFWSTGVAVALHRLWVAPYRARQLYRLGLPARGRVTGKRSARGKGVRYYVAYEYEPAGGRVLRGEMPVRQADYEAVAEGREVAVLYAPEQPERSVVYELGDYTVVGRPGPG